MTPLTEQVTIRRIDMTTDRFTQRGRLRQMFTSRPFRPIPLYPDILGLNISQYGSRIKELRDLEGMCIVNDGIWVDGSHHTWFVYCPGYFQDIDGVLRKEGYRPTEEQGELCLTEKESASILQEVG
jgi:hypothetical protein